MHLVFDDQDAWVLRSVHDERIPTVQDGAVAVAGVERHQRVTPLDLRRKAREDIAIFEHRVVGDGIEVVVAIDRTGQPCMTMSKNGSSAANKPVTSKVKTAIEYRFSAGQDDRLPVLAADL